MKINDSKITSNEEIANAFNEYFTNIGPSLTNSIDESNTSFKTFVKSAESKMDRFRLVSVGKVVKLLKGLSNCKAAGLDKISDKILKVAATTIAPSLTHIFNHGLISNCFPYEWKMARLVPIHKKGPRNLTENYRPISILPAISKIIERIMYDQIYQYLSDNYGVPLRTKIRVKISNPKSNIYFGIEVENTIFEVQNTIIEVQNTMIELQNTIIEVENTIFEVDFF